MDASPVVDVGIPVYKRADYLAGAIESVLAQTMGHFRLLISEDGPATEAVRLAVAPYLEDPRVSLVAAGEHLGAARHMTRIVAAGQAPYFALLHDDDLWDDTFLERRVALLDAHPECGFVFSRVRVIGADGAELEQMPETLPEGLYTPAEIVPILVNGNFVPSPAVVVRRGAYDSVGGSFDLAFARIYDFELWFRLAVAAPVGVLAGTDAAWRVHDRQSTRSVADRQHEFALFLDRAQRGATDVPGFVLSERDSRRILAGWSLTNALDAAEQGDVRVSLMNVRAAVRARPTVAVDPRFVTLLLTLPFGRPGARALRALRTKIRRSNVDVHVATRVASSLGSRRAG